MSVRTAAPLLALAPLLWGCVESTYSPPMPPPPAYAAPPPAPPSYPYPYAFAPQPTWGPAMGAVQAVAFAQSRIGTPYCWGGTGPRCFDCSGLTRAAWMAGGKLIPRTSEEQLAALSPIPPAYVQPGDILWRPGHVALYVGQGWAVAATHTGDYVRYQRADYFVRAVRP